MGLIAEIRGVSKFATTYDEVPLHVDDDSVATQLVEGPKLAPHRHDILVVYDVETVWHTPLKLLSE